MAENSTPSSRIPFVSNKFSTRWKWSKMEIPFQTLRFTAIISSFDIVRHRVGHLCWHWHIIHFRCQTPMAQVFWVCIHACVIIFFMHCLFNSIMFFRYNSTQLVSLCIEHEDKHIGWYNRFARHPYYGETGLNSGVRSTFVFCMPRFMLFR